MKTKKGIAFTSENKFWKFGDFILINNNNLKNLHLF